MTTTSGLRESILLSVDDALKLAQRWYQFSYDTIPGFPETVRYIQKSYQDDPVRIVLELFLLLFAAKYLLAKAYKPESNEVSLTEKEINELIDDWQPESLVPPLSSQASRDLSSLPVIAGPTGPRVKLTDGREYLNLATFDFLSLSAKKEVFEKAANAVRVYGVGACGPPGFYGTIDVHIELEKSLAKFIGVEEAIIYSQAFATISSVIPAFSKRGDILVVDEGVGFAVQKGVQISRSTVRYFRHNDMQDLERVLTEIKQDDKKHRRPLTRRFIVVEGLYQNYGDIAPLPELLKLKEKFKYRLIVEESNSFGVLGSRGAGLADHFGIDATQVDIMSSSMANVLASAGGFCAGTKEVVDHQRLSGAGYCFSAAMPAMLAVAANESVKELEKNGKAMLDQLRTNAAAFVHSFGTTSEYAEVVGDYKNGSAILHVRLKGDRIVLTDERADELLQTVVETVAKEHKLLVSRAKYVRHQELHPPKPSIRVVVSAGHSRKEIESAAKAIKKTIDNVLKAAL